MIPAGLLLPMSASLAADVYWDNPETGLFSEATNWDTGMVPTFEDNAFIANGGTAQVVADEVVEVNILRIQDGALEAVDAVITTGLTSPGWQTPGDFQVGGIAGQMASLTTSGETSITTGRVRIGGYNTSDEGDSPEMHGVVTMSGNSLLMTAAGGAYDLWLGNGNGSTATLNMSGTSRIIVNSSMTSGRAGGSATVNLTEDSAFEVSTYGNIGEGGDANWTVSDNATFTLGGNLRLGGGDTQLTVKDSAIVVVGGEFQIGNGGGNVGIVNILGGELTANSWMSIGREGGTGSVAVSGTGRLKKQGVGNLIVGDVSTGTMDVSGNASVTADSDIWVGFGNGGNGTLTLSGGSTQTSGIVIVARGDGSQGSLKLNGGTLTANAIQKGDNTGVGTATVEFNGGTLRAGADSVDLISGFESADVVIQSGGLIVDTNKFDVTINLDLQGVGGLVKVGEGILTLTGNNTYQGSTAVFGGTLSITTGFLADDANVILASNVTFDLNFAGVDTIQALNINGVWQPVGTYGGLDSDADFKLAIFTGSGVLNVTAPVPEPGTMALMAIGFGATLWTLRRRRN